jgi:hypothetical protein
MVATVVPMTGTMRNRASITVLVGVALIQCYATRTGDGCVPLRMHATMAECRALASEYRKFDARALSVTGLPAKRSDSGCFIPLSVHPRNGS